MKPSDLTALNVLAALAWGGNRADLWEDVVSDGRLVFDRRALEPGVRAALSDPGASVVRPGTASRAWISCVEWRGMPVEVFGIDDDAQHVTWDGGAVCAIRFALARLACPADEFAPFHLGDERGLYGLLGIRNGVAVWALMGIAFDEGAPAGGAS